MDLLTYCESFAPNAERGYERGDEGYDMNEAREAYMTRVEAEGCRVVLPCECQLQIDIGSADHYEVFLQAAFGSDPVRELLSATRLMHGDKHPTLFVEAAVCAA